MTIGKCHTEVTHTMVKSTVTYTTEEMREYINQYRTRRKEDAISRLGGKCLVCGSTEQLEFDHINRSEKLASIGKMWTASKEKFETELAKCQLLCRDCHTDKGLTAGDITRSEHGSRARYDRYGCRCRPCTDAKVGANRKYLNNHKGQDSAGEEDRL